GGAESELLETRAQLFEAAAHAGGKNPEVGPPDRQHAPVEVLPLALKRRGEAVENVCIRIVELVQPHEVDGEAGVHVERAGRGRVEEVDLALELTGEQVIRRPLVDPGRSPP